MKYWLIITLFYNGQVVERHEIRYKNEASCYMAMEPYQVPYGYVMMMECIEK